VDFVEPVTELFDRTDALFDFGDLPLARAAYEKLFRIFELEDDYGRGVRAEDLRDVEIGEALARYLRAVYETEPAARRPEAMFDEMQRVQSWVSRRRPMLEDIIQISPRPLPGQDSFLEDWITFLRDQNDRDADAWLREAIRLSQGTQGLQDLARTEGTTRPAAYLDWLVALAEEGKHQEVLAAAQEALETLRRELPIRAAIADQLCAAAAKLNDVEVLLMGRWEGFVAVPSLHRLLALWEATPNEEAKKARMQEAAQHLEAYVRDQPFQRAEVWWDDDLLECPTLIDKSLLAHAYLLSAEWRKALQLSAGEKVLGWSNSNNPQGVVVSFFLVLVSGQPIEALPPNLNEFWHRVLQTSAGFNWRIGENDVLERLVRAHAECLRTVRLRHAEQEEVLSWCLDVARRRVEAIVSGQHRRSYNKAAMLIVACAEVLRLRGEENGARELLDEVRARFPRHRSFQAELKAAVERMEASMLER
jgi:hypothetical protein